MGNLVYVLADEDTVEQLRRGNAFVARTSRLQQTPMRRRSRRGSGGGIDYSMFEFGIVRVDAEHRLVYIKGGHWLDGTSLSVVDAGTLGAPVSIGNGPALHIYAERDTYGNMRINPIASPTFPISTSTYKKKCLCIFKGTPTLELVSVCHTGVIQS